MKLVYFGSSHFSKGVLEDLIEKNILPSAVVTTPDRPQGRGLKISPTPVKEFAQSKSISVFTPSSLRDKELVNTLRALSADFFLVVSYGKIITEELILIPKIMPLALHPSLLPRYRGPAPIQWVLLKGEKETGVTVFKITEKVDCGPILLQKKIIIEDKDDFVSLSKKLMALSVKAVVDVIEMLKTNNYTFFTQDENLASYAPKLKKEDGRIDWSLEAEQIKNLVRATKDWPSAYTFYKKKLIKILDVDVVNKEPSASPSEIVSLDKEGIGVATKKFILRIKRLRPEGKKEMNANSFICGYRVRVGEKFNDVV